MSRFYAGKGPWSSGGSRTLREGNLYRLHFGYYENKFFRIKLTRAGIEKITKPAGDMKKTH
jgi:hypothetical protein